jgi:ribonuclease PH
MKTMKTKEITQLRDISIERQYTKYAPGSVLISFGDTKVICTASIEDKVPFFLRDSGEGWLTAEYCLLPSATQPRFQREIKHGKVSGRTNEIQRLIGRSLRSIIDFSKIPEKTIIIDADVIQADGGTRTAAITGGMIALYDAVQHLLMNKGLEQNPIKELLAAVSVGIVNGQVVCDLCYEEDSQAEVDMNVIMTESGRYVEIQGTAEKEPFSEAQLTEMLTSAKQGITRILQIVKEELKI